MKTIGLTGGIASGKSAVCRILDGYPIVEADLVAREVVEPGQPGLDRVAEAFGSQILLADGRLDRAALRATIANSAEAQKRLNGILHPLIIGDILARIQAFREAGEPLAFVCAALMLETGSYRAYDAVVLVTAPFEVRLARLLQRDGMDETTARNLMARQWSDEEKRRLATVEIRNDSTLEALEQRTWRALAKLGVGRPES